MKEEHTERNFDLFIFNSDFLILISGSMFDLEKKYMTDT